MERTDLKTGETITTIASFSTKAEVVLKSTDLNELYEKAKNKILELLSTFQQLGSSWRLVSVKKMDMNMIEYKPIKGKSYIPLPKELAAKKAIINIKNEDNECFKWCVARFFNTKEKNSESVDRDLKEQANKLNWEKIKFPVPLHQITQFEKNNQKISVNVFGYESSVYPLRISENKNRQHQIDLLLISNDETNHNCLNKSLRRLLLSQTSNHKCTVHYCRNFLLGFNTEECLFKHKSYCDTHNSVRIELPKPNTIMKFNHFKKSMRVPFVVYADFESIITPINICTPNPNDSYTKQYQRHTPSSFCYYIKCFDESVYKGKPVTFTANSEEDDVAQIFVDRLEADIRKIYNTYLKFPKKMIFTPENKENFYNAKVCHVCEELLKEDKVRDYCYITGKYRGAAHKDYNKLDLLLRKGVYPYEWVDSISKLNETQLTSKESFYSRLNDEDISDEDYLHAQTVWKEFNCKTFRYYHNIYNVSDVFLLADVFKNFRDVCMKNYKLDPAWYYTSPGLAWDVALKETKIELELISDYDMILMIKQGIRGEISMVSNRIGTANNKYMETYDESKESTFIQYLDANNLYGWAMSKHLSTRGFEWMSEEELKNWRSTLCIFEVDLEYPENLHDAHNDYPLALEKLKIDKVEKLVPNLNHKKNYIIHYENLKLYEKLGLKLTKIHRGIKFEESAWLIKYIELNTNLRTKATNDFEKDFFKLMNNSVFGKTMENIENRVDVRLITKREEAIKLASKPNYESRTIYDENLIAIHMERTELIYNKPIYLGMCILDLSKTLMYEFHYDYIKNKYGNKAKLLFTDTDSLAYEIKTKDFYADISNDIENKFDTSEFDKNHPGVQNGFKLDANKKVLGMFKDEAGGAQIEEFIGLRLYSYKVRIQSEKISKM
ncbi:uncharacterized protein LOC136084050 [Hydra vulgaris]|uniref:uncharacterized protein LOC136084050 n=1 Tax=Hydra vulgaris TaxID=6087 RepID=UPI0032E9C9F4